MSYRPGREKEDRIGERHQPFREQSSSCRNRNRDLAHTRHEIPYRILTIKTVILVLL
jgi:hypothetical protein